MAIQAQLPTPTPAVLPTTGGDLLALLTGKPVNALVANVTLEGLTQLLLGKEAIKLALPANFPPGTTLTLQIKDGQLLVQPQTPSGNVPAPPQANAPTLAPSPNPSLPPGQSSVVNLAMARPGAPPTPSGQGASAPPVVPQPTQVSPASALQAQLQASFIAPRPVVPLGGSPLPAASPLPSAPAANAPTPPTLLQGKPTPAVAQPAMQGSAPPTPRPEGLGALLANLATLEGRLAQLPAPVIAAARQFLGQQVNLAKGRLTGERLQQAVVSAGILGAGAEEAEEGAIGRPGLLAGGDELKAGLLQLRKTLMSWVTPERAEAAAALAKPLQPLRPGAPRAAKLEPFLLPGSDTPEEIGKSLLEQTDAALGRLRAGHAAVPEQLARAEQPQAPPRSEWAGQVPMFLGPEAGLAQFQISRDGGSSAGAETRSWQVRFAINFSVIGEVGAHVLLRGKRASVTLWAERNETVDAIDTMLPELVDAFAIAGFEAGSIQCRQGAPKPAPIAAGGLVDSVR